MFTGIIKNIGVVHRIERKGDWRLFIQSDLNLQDIEIGASISCSGCCLTVVSTENDLMAFDVSAETLSKTAICDWREGTRINIERSLKIGDEIGGHIVTGHVDGLAVIEDIFREGDSHRVRISVPDDLSLFIASKGSVALDGISLTVNEVEGNVFGVNIIPYTWHHTTLGGKRQADRLNIEIDIMARYVARQLGRA